MKYLSSLFLMLLITNSSCSVKSEKINYGKENCRFCSMTIVDRQHAAELVTKKGKVFKFDAIECMINYLNKNFNAEIGLLFVNDFQRPGKLIAAESSTYLISENIPSPMGAFLSAFATLEDAQKMEMEKGGEIYNWDNVQQRFK